jgi:hypothetical protein
VNPGFTWSTLSKKIVAVMYTIYDVFRSFRESIMSKNSLPTYSKDNENIVS